MTPVIITNTDSYENIEILVDGSVKEEEKLLSIG